MTQNNTQAEWGTEMDTQEHLQTYDGFIKVTKWSVAVTALVLVLMAIFLL